MKDETMTGRLVLICICLQAKKDGVGQAAFFNANVVGKTPKPKLSDVCSAEAIGDGRLYDKDPSVYTFVDKGFPVSAVGGTPDDLKWRMANGLGPEPLFVLRRKGGKWYVL